MSVKNYENRLAHIKVTNEHKAGPFIETPCSGEVNSYCSEQVKVLGDHMLQNLEGNRTYKGSGSLRFHCAQFKQSTERQISDRTICGCERHRNNKGSDKNEKKTLRNVKSGKN